MSEILTESFCERCGTRYTFQTAAPRRGRLARLRVATKGLRNYVLEDGSSLEDAFGEARNEEERAISGQQLEAFHQTFNFCLSCRQYTCGNCWNGAENRCLSCAPDLSREVMPAPLPDLAMGAGAPAMPAGAALPDMAWPEADLARPAAALGWPEADLAAGNGHDAGVAAVVMAGALAAEPAPTAEAVAPEAEAVAETEAVAPEAEAVAVAEPEPEAVPAEAEGVTAEAEAVAAESEPEAVTEPEPEAVAAAATAADLAAATAEPAVAEPEPADPHARAARAAARTALLLGRFRPGQNLDAELEAYERGERLPAATTTEAAQAAADAATTTPPVVEAPPEGGLAAAAIAAAAVPEAAPEAPAPAPVEPAPAPVEPAPAPVEPAPAPVEPAPAAAQPAPIEPASEPAEPAPAPRRDDRVEVPVWRIVAPDTQAPAGTPAPTPAWPPVAPPPASGAPAWPAAAWAAPEQPVAAVRAREAMWAESSRDVVERSNVTVQACVSCGLPLSATARFCRRCGSRQG